MINGILVTVLIDLTKFKIWNFTVDWSSNPWFGLLDPHPIFCINLSSCNTQTAFKQSRDASNKFHNVSIVKKCVLIKLLKENRRYLL